MTTDTRSTQTCSAARREQAVAVVAVTHDSTRVLRDWLVALEASGHRDRMELCVVDSGSGEEERALLERDFRPRLEILRLSSNVGFGRACNLGAAATRSPWLLFTNPDTQVLELPPWLWDGSGDLDSLVGAMRVSDNGPPIPLGFRHSPSARWELEALTRGRRARTYERTAERPAWVSGAALLISRRAFQAVGGFPDDLFLYFEDADLCAGHRRRGGSVVVDQRFVVAHTGGGSSADASAGGGALESVSRLSARIIATRYGHDWYGPSLYTAMALVYIPRRVAGHLLRHGFSSREVATAARIALDLLTPGRVMRRLGAADLPVRTRGFRLPAVRTVSADLPSAVRVAAAFGRRGRAVACWLDLMRANGAGYLWRRLLLKRRAADGLRGARSALYARIWRDAAQEIGVEVNALPGEDELELQLAGQARRIRHQFVGLDDADAFDLAFDKARVHQLLMAAGLPTPEYAEFDFGDWAPALAFLARGGGACVVKPSGGTGGGEGTTAGVRTRAEFMRACLRAGRVSNRLLIERQALGDVYRLLFLDGAVLDVLRNRAPTLTGDGRSTVEQLIEAENERRIAARGELGLNLLAGGLDTVLQLERTGLSLASVPARGQTFVVQVVTNHGRIEDRETFHGEISPSVIGSAREAVRAVGLRLGGVDLVTPDPTRPLAQTGGIILEVNSAPGLHHHYLVANRQAATPVAVPVLRKLFDEVEQASDAPALAN
jgi:GT2 family glycosyltransferase/D-alanine-D-alanine ligase-like ATP-grasp enzyme